MNITNAKRGTAREHINLGSDYLTVCASIALMLFAGAIVRAEGVPATLPSEFPIVGNEREVAVDPQTHRPFTYLTSGQFTSTVFYPTCRSWTADSRHVLLESQRPRPAGTSKPAERQLLMADIQTGELRWLATLDLEDTASYGVAHRTISSQYHADYAPDSHTLIYFDMTGHRLYWLSLATGRRELLWHMTDGTIGDPPSISSDGKRVVFYVWHPGPAENSHFTGMTNAIYSLDIDAATGKASGPLHIVTAYAGRKGPDYEKNKSDQTLINHCQINPKYPDWIGYAHQYNGSVSNGSWERARIWATYVDGRDEGPLLITPARRWHTHEVWGPMGDWIYFVDSGDIARVNASDKRFQTLAKGLNPLALHLTVSADESRIVFDTVSSWQYDKDDTRSSPLVLLDVPSGKTTTLTSLRAGRTHPRHPHPNLSPDGQKVAFVSAAGLTGRVAVVVLP